MNELIYSEKESKAFGFKIARGEFTEIDEKCLLDEIAKNEYDVCKIRVPAALGNLFIKLEKLNIPFQFVDVFVKFQKNILTHEIPPFQHPELVFELYDGSQKNIFKQLVKETFEQNISHYFQNPFLPVIPKTTLQEAHSEWAAEFNNKINPGKIGWLLKWKNEYAGFYICQFTEKESEPISVGIVEKFRNQGFYFDVFRHYSKYFKKDHNHLISGTVQIQHYPSQRAIAREFGPYKKAFIHLHLNSFLSASIQNPISIDFKTDSTEAKQSSLQLKILETVQKVKGVSFSFDAMRVIKIKPLLANHQYQLKISFPTNNDFLNLTVLKIYDEQNSLCLFVYLYEMK